jgi:hypothetical protein
VIKVSSGGKSLGGNLLEKIAGRPDNGAQDPFSMTVALDSSQVEHCAPLFRSWGYVQPEHSVGQQKPECVASQDFSSPQRMRIVSRAR